MARRDPGRPAWPPHSNPPRPRSLAQLLDGLERDFYAVLLDRQARGVILRFAILDADRERVELLASGLTDLQAQAIRALDRDERARLVQALQNAAEEVDAL